MKFPYGISDFYKLITEGYFYVDRTAFIRLIEETGSQLLFLRPRRFGKSLLLSMLENYYDVAKADEFEKLFGHLAIGKNPTERHNQYFVMKWDFSAVNPNQESEELKQSLYEHVNSCIEDCAIYYQNYLTREVDINPTNALASLQSFLTAIKQTQYQLYLLIDEYDNFANEIMMGRRPVDQERYKSLLYGEGCLKAIFKAVKSASSGNGLDRVFITGISPVVLSDITSGYNVAKNIYLNPKLNDLCGFLETEIRTALCQIIKDCGLPDENVESALAMMRRFYNGYCFSYDSEEFVYNPTMALYFLEYFQEFSQYPQEPLDSNLAMDRGKIEYISQLPNGDKVIMNALNSSYPLSIQRLAHRFGVEDMLYERKDTTFMASLLYFFGVLTLSGRTELGELILKIPNLVIKKLYAESIQKTLLPDINHDEILHTTREFYSTGNMQPLCEFIEQRFSVFDNRDYRCSNELTVKTAFLVMLFNDIFYIMDSETELEREYADLTMIIRPDMRKYKLLDHLIEFKFLSLKELGLSGDDAKELNRSELQALPDVQSKLEESKAKLMDYRKVLENKYGDKLRLHCHSVVSIGFERLVWKEVE